MSQWNQKNLHTHMHVYTSDNEEVGHIAHLYEDSFVLHKGVLFAKDRYLPYSSITSVNNDQLHINLNTAQLHEKMWDIRPDYEDHLGDPVQLNYDRGHGVHDPFDEESTEHA